MHLKLIQKIVISNFETELTKSIENKFKESQIIKFLNFKDRKIQEIIEMKCKPGTQNISFFDSDEQKPKFFLKQVKMDSMIIY